MEQAILLDTNVLSELMRPQPDVRVLAWFGVNTNAGYYISAVTQAEILLGISLLSAGKRQSRLADAAAEMFSEEFSGRSLSFDKARDKVLDIGCGKRFFLFDFTKVVSGIGISGQII